MFNKICSDSEFALVPVSLYLYQYLYIFHFPLPDLGFLLHMLDTLCLSTS